MKYFLIVSILFILNACNEGASKNTEKNNEVEVEHISEENVFTSYDTVHQLIQGSWRNTLDPNSVIIFNEKTTTNKYQEIVAKENVPYIISTSCAMEAKTKSSSFFRYITTKGTYTECYYIKTLDETTLEMDFEKGDVTLNFTRVE